MSHKRYHGKTRRVYDVIQHAVDISVNKRVKGQILAKRINVWIEHGQHCKSQEDFLQQVKEKEAEEKSSWVQLEGQPAPSREACFVRPSKEPELCRNTIRNYGLKTDKQTKTKQSSHQIKEKRHLRSSLKLWNCASAKS